MHSFMSQRTSSATAPPAPVPSNSASSPHVLDLHPIQLNVYWIAAILFTLPTVYIAMLLKQKTRDHRHRLVFQRLVHPPPFKSARIRDSPDERIQDLYVMAADTMYRLFLVGLVLFLLGFVHDVLTPISSTVGTLIIVWGMFYAFSVIGRSVDH